MQHGEIPYHFRAFAVNETTGISAFQNFGIAVVLGFGAGIRRGA
jgi:hypothetical protein